MSCRQTSDESKPEQHTTASADVPAVDGGRDTALGALLLGHLLVRLFCCFRLAIRAASSRSDTWLNAELEGCLAIDFLRAPIVC